MKKVCDIVTSAISELSSNAPQKSVRFSKLLTHVGSAHGFSAQPVDDAMEAVIEAGLVEFTRLRKETCVRVMSREVIS